MCGFVAIAGRSSPEELTRMGNAVAVRGPDDNGQLVMDGFSAVHHRLSIIGPDERGRQPMVVDDVVVVFNGCIYNYKVLRAQLEADGITFSSNTDTEILPHLYRRFGMGMFSLLNGMFAIVLWDRRTRTLITARDPLGEKPLFVCEQGGRIGLASMLSAFEHGEWSLTPDIHAVHDVLCRMRTEAPRTMYQEIRQLPPGCYAVSTDGAPLTLRRYFFLPDPDEEHEMDGVRATLEKLLDDAFLLRAVSDKPLGVFLSGGIDSSLVAESLARQLPGRLHTFSVRFSDASADYDESGYARQVAEHIGSEHAVLEVEADAHASLHGLAAGFDLPVTNAAALPTYLIAKAAKPHVDVALSGVGGDELFGGYPRYLGMAWHDRMQRMPGRHALQSLLRLFGEGAGHRNLRGRARRFLEGLDVPAHEAYMAWTSSAQSDWNEMFTRPFVTLPEGSWSSASGMYGGLAGLLEHYGPVNGAMAYDMLTYLPDDLLVVGDRMSMAHALELRSPFLDTRLLSFALSLDPDRKVSGPPWREGLKVLLKEVARKRLPVSAVDRPKQGFMAPMKHWLRGPLAGEIERLASGNPLGGLVRREYVEKAWHRHRAGEDCSDLLWGLLLLDTWMQQRDWHFS